jgi:hypothetical protein
MPKAVPAIASTPAMPMCSDAMPHYEFQTNRCSPPDNAHRRVSGERSVKFRHRDRNWSVRWVDTQMTGRDRVTVNLRNVGVPGASVQKFQFAKRSAPPRDT